MKTSVWTIAAALCLSSLAGCKKSSDGGGGTITTVGITVSKKAVVANGTNSVTVNITDNAGGTITVSTSRGTFAGGGGSATVTGPAASLTLISCNAATDAACAGTATITASEGTASAQATVSFGTLAAACLADCTADAACPAHACVPVGGGTGTCSSTTPSVCVGGAACTPTETTEATCNDGLDNDCNGNIDCADAGCDNQQCKVGSPTFLCKSGVCTDTLTGLGIDVTPARTRMPANGTATTTVTVTATSGGKPAGGMGVTVSTTAGSFAATTGTTNTDGIATFTFTAGAAPAVATLTAQLTGVPTVSKTATITFPAIGALQVPDKTPVQFPVQGVKGSGFQEFGFISVLVKDDTGQAYPDGLAVRFEHRTLGGSTLGAPLAACVPADPGCVAFQGATSSGSDPADTVGIATGFLYSGTIAGTLVTTATATVGAVTRTITLPTVAVVGAKANGANFSVVCSPRNVPALAETDCAISLVDAPFTCEALLKDRYGNVLGTATQVTFMSEAASVGKVTTTPPYDPTKDPPPDLGIATQIFNTLGSGLPFDVAPDPGEPFSDLGAPDVCGRQIHNPRDGLVTLIAIADGEEAFFDSNGNGVYDLGEPFVDQGEPFVDQNDNGTWDPGEWFLDVNGNGTWDGPNGVWDAATKIWTQTVVVYTGTPATLPSGANFLGTRFASVVAGACTPTPAPAPFAVLAAKTGTPPVPATSQTYLVFASDENLNLLDTGTTYGVDVLLGTVKVNYLGLAKVADDLGLFYRFWPCDQTGVCASQCRSTGAALPCVMTPTITGFECGLGSSVIITGGSSPDPGTDIVRWNVSTPYSVFGTGKTALGGRSLTGTNL